MRQNFYALSNKKSLSLIISQQKLCLIVKES